jgi:hypothetical protein
MEYKAKEAVYEVFRASMTIDTRKGIYIPEVKSCEPCQCHCQSCIGGKLPEDREVIGKAETENALEKLLAA